MALKAQIPVTKTITAAIARTQFGQLLELVRSKRARFVVSRNGEPAAVILGIEDYLESVVGTPAALAAIQAESRKRGVDLLSITDINAEIDAVRKARRPTKKRA
jgi:prevent-host-death family protein